MTHIYFRVVNLLLVMIIIWTEFNNRVLKFLTIFTDNAYNKAQNKKDLPYIFSVVGLLKEKN